MRIGSSLAIERMGQVARIPYATVERMTRPLKDKGMWPRRGSPDIRPYHLASLIASFAAHLPSESLKAVELCDELVAFALQEDETRGGLRDGATCTRPNALLSICPTGGRSLHVYLTEMIRVLAEMDRELRHSHATELVAADWSLAIGLDPAFASIAWYEAGRPPAQNYTTDPEAFDSPEATPSMEAKPARRWCSLRWRLKQSEFETLSGREPGVERLVSIPFQVLATAAEICLDARQLNGTVLTDENAAPLAGGAAPGRDQTQGLDARAEPSNRSEAEEKSQLPSSSGRGPSTNIEGARHHGWNRPPCTD